MYDCSKDSNCDSGEVCGNANYTSNWDGESVEYNECILRSDCGATFSGNDGTVTYTCIDMGPNPNLGLIFGVGGGVLALLLIIFVVVRIIKKKQ